MKQPNPPGVFKLLYLMLCCIVKIPYYDAKEAIRFERLLPPFRPTRKEWKVRLKKLQQESE